MADIFAKTKMFENFLEKKIIAPPLDFCQLDIVFTFV